MGQLDLLTVMTPMRFSPVSLSDSFPEPLAVPEAPPATAKADGAYRTISEVSQELDVPQHVLRFWETHFPQVKPSRMRGARRYYRPEDVETLRTIKTLLYQKGYTIKGAKKFLRSGEPLEMVLPVEEVLAAAQMGGIGKKEFKISPAHTASDRQSLVSELRVLKSMLTSLL